MTATPVIGHQARGCHAERSEDSVPLTLHGPGPSPPNCPCPPELRVGGTKALVTGMGAQSDMPGLCIPHRDGTQPMAAVLPPAEDAPPELAKEHLVLRVGILGMVFQAGALEVLHLIGVAVLQAFFEHLTK